jgi:hypothetical protein
MEKENVAFGGQCISLVKLVSYVGSNMEKFDPVSDPLKGFLK